VHLLYQAAARSVVQQKNAVTSAKLNNVVAKKVKPNVVRPVNKNDVSKYTTTKKIGFDLKSKPIFFVYF